ncbi:hypothetical protein AB0F72_08385 [Actinoplanes sp. NPDC023936]|uniref:hypothetical protein n=1 Tax=Actinoplanes sp. NPDC023936 TaxID=3154910 RepID=UPI0033DF0997
MTMPVSAPGPAADLIDHAAGIIVRKQKEPYTAPYHWAGALWEAGMLVAPGTPPLDDDDRAELEAHRDGVGHLAEDPMHAGQPVHEIYSHADGESRYWLQVTHQGMPLWSCACCGKLTIGPPGSGAPERCAGCEYGTADDLGPMLYETQAACRSWTASDGGQYGGACQIAGTDGCQCEEEAT